MQAVPQSLQQQYSCIRCCVSTAPASLFACSCQPGPQSRLHQQQAVCHPCHVPVLQQSVSQYLVGPAVLLLLLQSMFVSEWTDGKGWDEGALKPYGPMQLMPSAQVRNSSCQHAHASIVRCHPSSLALVPGAATVRTLKAAGPCQSASPCRQQRTGAKQLSHIPIGRCHPDVTPHV